MSVVLLDSDWAMRTHQATAAVRRNRMKMGVAVHRISLRMAIQQFCNGQKTSVGLPKELWFECVVNPFGWAAIGIAGEDGVSIAQVNRIHAVGLEPGKKIKPYNNVTQWWACVPTTEMLAFLDTATFRQLGEFIVLFPENYASMRVEPADVTGVGKNKCQVLPWDGTVTVNEGQGRGVLLCPEWEKR